MTYDNIVENVPGARSDPYSGYNFVVEIDGIIGGGFNEVSGLGIQTDVERKLFGGENDIEYNFISGTKYSDITLKYGITDSDMFWEWYNDVINGKIKRKNGSIYLKNYVGSQIVRWDFYEACPIKLDGPVLNSLSNAVAIETLVLMHHGLKKTMVKND